ncbi:hypothetical protein M3Y97_00828400 [Aphelenchoides bicaudatus]|nr:hypothetical protein M3Y97_00828400 [Aphelenchoides bicaudatus]
MVNQCCEMFRSQSFNDLNSTDDFNDLGKELTVIKKLCARHEILFKSFYLWKNRVLKNEYQLEVLSETAHILRARRENLARTLALRRASKCYTDNQVLKRLDSEIRAVEKQVDEWMKDLAEVSSDRTKLNIDLIQLRCKLRHSLTNINLAHIDFEVIEQQHRDVWRKFLYDIPGSKLNKFSLCDKEDQQLTTK